MPTNSVKYARKIEYVNNNVIINTTGEAKPTIGFASVCVYCNWV